MRADVAAGRGDSVRITEGTFSLAEHERFLADNADAIAASRSPARVTPRSTVSCS